jgi:hypothetical protein
VTPSANDGPIPELIGTELTLARSGALDADLISNQAFYGSNFSGLSHLSSPSKHSP